jgi:hypothetical protein
MNVKIIQLPLCLLQHHAVSMCGGMKLLRFESWRERERDAGYSLHAVKTEITGRAGNMSYIPWPSSSELVTAWVSYPDFRSFVINYLYSRHSLTKSQLSRLVHCSAAGNAGETLHHVTKKISSLRLLQCLFATTRTSLALLIQKLHSKCIDNKPSAAIKMSASFFFLRIFTVHSFLWRLSKIYLWVRYTQSLAKENMAILVPIVY